MFLGRDREKQQVLDFIYNSSMKTSIIYGRRRVGKSELITHCLEISKVKYLYYECKQTTEKNNLESIFEILSELYNLPQLFFKDFESLLKYIFTLEKKDPLVIVLDEYQYIREIIKGLDSIMQSIIDNNKKSPIKIILCGSYIDVMESLLEEDNPLYGRFDYKLKLLPMNYYDSSLFYKNYSNEDKVKIYSVFGGIPYYNILVDDKKSVEQNIIDLVSSNTARLENEISGYLKNQLSKINNANEAIEILAGGYSKYKDILLKSGIEKGPTLIDALDKLVSMGLVSKITPINDENNKKKIRYTISDPLSKFYYKYIYKNKSRIMIMDDKIFYDKFIKDDFENIYVPKYFEEIAREYLIEKNKKGLINPPFDKIGKYYYDDSKNHRNGEFDIVTHDEYGYIFYEVKFKNKPLSKKMIEEEIQQIKNCGIDCNRYGFITKNGFEQKTNDIIQITIDDLYE